MHMSTKTIHISLPESLRKHMEERAAKEHYGTLSDYVRALIREDLKRQDQDKLEQLLLEGVRSGQGKPMNPKEWDKLWQEVTEAGKHNARG
jgi:antitoxin ParD1/3/4